METLDSIGPYLGSVQQVVQPKTKLIRNRKRTSEGYKSFPKNQCPSVCRVCYNPAAGYQYEVPSCNGCKIFFRRAILNGGKLKCSRSGTCLQREYASGKSGRLCRACRLKKCISVGMNPLTIQAESRTEEGRVLRNEIAKQYMKQGWSSEISSLIIVEEDITNRIIRKLTHIENSIESLQRSGIPPGFRDIRTLEELLESRPILTISEIPSLKYCPHPCYTSKSSRKKNYVHGSFLASIEYSKMFDFSQRLDLKSKMILIKHTTLICSNMMNAFIPIHEMKPDIFLNENKRFNYPLSIQSAFSSHQVDRIEYLLFKAIMLCNSAVYGLSAEHQEIIEQERNQYVKSLLSYCLLQHGKLNGPARLTTILAMASIIENQSKNQKDMFLHRNAKHYQEHKELGKTVKKCISHSYEGILEL